MARRRIGQERFGFATDRDQRSSLDDLVKLIDWTPIDCALRVISCAAKGEPAWPPLSLFKAMLLSIWYDLSDVKLAEALDDRGSFRRFCGFSVSEPTPRAHGFCAFSERPLLAMAWTGSCSRKSLVSSRQRRSVCRPARLSMRRSLPRPARVTAKRIGSNTRADRRFMVSRPMSAPMPILPLSRNLPSRLPTSTMAGLAPMLCRPIPARCLPTVLIEEAISRRTVRAKGGTPRIVATGMWGRDEAETSARLHAWNRPIHRIRGRIEKIFGTWKRSYGLRRMRWRGLAKAAVQIHFTRHRLQYETHAHDRRQGLNQRLDHKKPSSIEAQRL